MTPSPSGSALGWALNHENARSASQSGRTSASSEGLVTRASAATASARRASPSGWASSSRRSRASTTPAGASPGASAGTPPASTASTRASGDPPAQAIVCDRRAGSSRPRAVSRASASDRARGPRPSSATRFSQPPVNQPAPGARREAITTRAEDGRRGSRFWRRWASSAESRSQESSINNGRVDRSAGAIASSRASARGARSRASTVIASMPRASPWRASSRSSALLPTPAGPWRRKTLTGEDSSSRLSRRANSSPRPTKRAASREAICVASVSCTASAEGTEG